MRHLLSAVALVAVMGASAARAFADDPQVVDDWRRQDGIGSAREPSTHRAAVERLVARGDRLAADLRSAAASPELSAALAGWQSVRQEYATLAAASSPAGPDEAPWRDLWLKAHRARRALALANPLARTGPVLFAKQVPAMFSHQLTQYYGSCARPGGGLFVLDDPGRSLEAREITAGKLPTGSYQHPEVSFDGKRILFAYCQADTAPKSREQHLDRVYHLYEIGADGRGLRQLTSGPYDDFAPRYLPDGKLAFISTRRGGYHRCGQGPCPVYTLAIANADGSDPHTVSFHETQEWDPVVMGDGRLLYTRWDYVDRNAVFYQQLWSCWPDGTNPRVYYGNNTRSPVGVWEARPVPGSTRVMATAAAHHAMTAGSIILVDVARGQDGPEPITRLTPDALFPEAEAPVANLGRGSWFNPTAAVPPAPPEQKRWPGHCYRTPYPLSETYFLAAYSYDPLIGEPDAPPAAMFGLYLVDAFGNKELLHRDPAISSLWPVPLRPRLVPPRLPAQCDPAAAPEGTFLLQDVNAAWPGLPAEPVRRLRIVQVLPKTTWHANSPTVGLANASPGKQVLGTVPVEADGSAYFKAPAKVALAFQALDERGEAIQTMRSLTYLQPGEHASCVGCHERRNTAPAGGKPPLALVRGPSAIEPGPDGSNPLSYPLLVQPVLDRQCVRCHDGLDPAAKVVLTGQPEGRYTRSYNALAPRVPFAAWGGSPLRPDNREPFTRPGDFGARGSPLMKLLRDGHRGVTLNADDRERLATWMDANALFYGTFDPADQARQQKGGRIAGPKLQ